MKKLKHNLKVIGIYSVLFMILLIPLNLGIYATVSVGIILGFISSMLNDIIIQLKKLNSDKFDNNVGMLKS